MKNKTKKLIRQQLEREYKEKCVFIGEYIQNCEKPMDATQLAAVNFVKNIKGKKYEDNLEIGNIVAYAEYKHNLNLIKAEAAILEEKRAREEMELLRKQEELKQEEEARRIKAETEATAKEETKMKKETTKTAPKKTVTTEAKKATSKKSGPAVV